MKSLITAFVLVGLLTSSLAIDLDDNCAVIPAGNAIYSICGFAILPPFSLSTTDGTLSFSIGATRAVPCNKTGTTFSTWTSALGACYDVANNDPAYTLIDAQDVNKGLQITYPAVINNPSAAVPASYQLIVNLQCDANLPTASTTAFQVSSSVPVTGPRVFTVTGASVYGCPVISYGSLIVFFKSHAGLFAAFIAIIGLFLTFFGLRLFKVAVFIIATLAATFLAGNILFAFISPGVSEWVLWVILAASLLIGSIVGAAAIRFEKFSYFVMGGCLGVVGAYVLYNAVLAPMIGAKAGTWPLYATIGLGALIGAGVGLYLLRNIVIIATAGIGSFIFVRAVSTFIGGFPSESDVAKGAAHFTPVIYAYLFFICLLGVVGGYYQFYELRKAGGHHDKNRLIYQQNDLE